MRTSRNDLKTRRGTCFYKTPSLLGVWYRGPFEHNGLIATLEDWFNPARTNDTYVPTPHAPGYGGAGRLERPARHKDPRGQRPRVWA